MIETQAVAMASNIDQRSIINGKMTKAARDGNTTEEVATPEVDYLYVLLL